MVSTHPPYPSNPGNPINKYEIDWCLSDGKETKNKKVKKRRKNANWMTKWLTDWLTDWTFPENLQDPKNPTYLLKEYRRFNFQY